MYKIGYMLRFDAAKKSGGDLGQIKKYISHGKDLGLFDGELICGEKFNINNFDVIHLTNIDRPVDLWFYYRIAKFARKPIVISTIHHSYDEINRYEKKARVGFLGMLNVFNSFQSLEKVRSIARCFQDYRLIGPTFGCLTYGMNKCQSEVVENCDFVLTLTKKEYFDIEKDFSVRPKNFEIIKNGFELQLTSELISAEDFDYDVVMIGRIEARKNQINVLRAVKNLGLKVCFVGAINKNHKNYVKKFFKELDAARADYLGELPQSKVKEILKRARVHVSASWFEVASLVDLEAYAQGCHVVSSLCGGTHETLGSLAEYVDPENIFDIREKILKLINKPRNKIEKNEHFEDWNAAAIKLHKIYGKVIGGKL